MMGGRLALIAIANSILPHSVVTSKQRAAATAVIQNSSPAQTGTACGTDHSWPCLESVDNAQIAEVTSTAGKRTKTTQPATSSGPIQNATARRTKVMVHGFQEVAAGFSSMLASIAEPTAALLPDIRVNDWLGFRDALGWQKIVRAIVHRINHHLRQINGQTIIAAAETLEDQRTGGVVDLPHAAVAQQEECHAGMPTAEAVVRGFVLRIERHRRSPRLRRQAPRPEGEGAGRDDVGRIAAAP